LTERYAGLWCYCKNYGYLVREKGGYYRVYHKVKLNGKWRNINCYVGTPFKSIKFLKKNEEDLLRYTDYRKAMKLVENWEEGGLSNSRLVRVIRDLRKYEKRLRSKL